MNAVDLRERVAQACRVLGMLGLADATAGHVSARVPGTDRMLIRARGPGETGVRFTTAAQIVEIDRAGRVAAGTDPDLQAPIEVFIHTEIYRARPDVHAVVHVHPPTVVLFTVCDVPLLPIFGAYNPAALRLALDGIPTYDRSILIKSPDLGADVAATLGDASVCLMRGHGVTAAAATLEAAAIAVVQLNELAEMNYRARLLGSPRTISADDRETFRSAPSPASNGRADALWRFLCRRAGETVL